VTRQRATDSLDDTSGGGGGLGLTGTGEGGGGTGDGIGLGGAGGKVGRADASAAARTQITGKLGNLKACFKDATKVTFKIDAQGRVALLYSTAVDDTTKACAEKVAKSIAFAKSATTVTIDIKP
jgi:hypothetical protein